MRDDYPAECDLFVLCTHFSEYCSDLMYEKPRWGLVKAESLPCALQVKETAEATVRAYEGWCARLDLDPDGAGNEPVDRLREVLQSLPELERKVGVTA